MPNPRDEPAAPASEQTTEECVQQAHDMYTSCMDAAAGSMIGCMAETGVVIAVATMGSRPGSACGEGERMQPHGSRAGTL
ncbi:MAG: hypothetical protein KF787_13500 [Phycisphaeraceae bacterium]|nr:hypothetical protein [Phycisphaerae bacterium]MBX3393650.1 hypothetical protein [Phycisphaeraceae bacterium]